MLKKNFDTETHEYKGTLYAASNPSMPYVLKVGCTTKQSVNDRLKQLSNSSVPHDFILECSVNVYNPFFAEKNIHKALNSYHINKEFFEVDVQTVKDLFTTIENKPVCKKNKKMIQVGDEISKKLIGQIINQNDKQCFAEIIQTNKILFNGTLYRFHQFLQLLKTQKYNLDDWQVNGTKLSDLADDLLYK